MIKSLREAQIADGLPRVLREQPWAMALSLAVAELHKKTMDYIDGSQIYTAIDIVAEEVLDALAVNWKIDWYDTEYDIEKKRRIVKTAMDVRRIMGTTRATRMQADAIYPGTMLEEWFEYHGEAGYFRLFVDITGSTEDNPVISSDLKEMERRLTAAKRWSAHIESLSYMVRRALVMRTEVKAWVARQPMCGAVYCGTWWMPATLGRSERVMLHIPAAADGYAYQPELTGTLPEIATEGYSVCGAVRCSGTAEGFTAASAYSGDTRCGTKP